MSRILIIEDESANRSNLQKILERNGHSTNIAASIQHAIDDYPLPSFELIITDLRLQGQPGTDIIKLAQGVPVLVMTNYASLRSAVDAMKMGAVDYIAKPFDEADILQIVSSILTKQTSNAPTSLSEPTNSKQILYGRCQAMRRVFKLMEKVAPTEATVLIQGETGTGKELAARSIFQLSRRSNQEYVCVNCAAIPESLIESELFGHEKGAFTGAVSARNGLIEAADGGTLFLDEIGELPLEAQARLLRVLQEGEIRRVGSTQSRKVDVRLIAATHRNLKALTKTGQFREDLFYRLNVIQLKLPPLRDRGNDILGLTDALLTKISAKLGKPKASITEDALKAIRSYNWPGNVRELENAIERGSILCDENIISAELLDIDNEVDDINIPQGLITPSSVHSPAPQHRTLSIEGYFQQFVLENQNQMSETELAQKLGISRKSLWEKRHKLGIPRKKSS